MDWLIWLAFIVIVALILVARLKIRRVDSFPYQLKASLFSPAERSFLGVLEKAVGDDYRVFGKVRVADVASVEKMSDRQAWTRAFNRISAKHIDFVICRRADLSIVAAVELDDKSHIKRQRQQRDRFLADLCEAINLPLIRVPAKRTYSVEDVRISVNAAFAPRQEQTSERVETDNKPRSAK